MKEQPGTANYEINQEEGYKDIKSDLCLAA